TTAATPCDFHASCGCGPTNRCRRSTALSASTRFLRASTNGPRKVEGRKAAAVTQMLAVAEAGACLQQAGSRTPNTQAASPKSSSQIRTRKFLLSAGFPQACPCVQVDKIQKDGIS